MNLVGAAYHLICQNGAAKGGALVHGTAGSQYHAYGRVLHPYVSGITAALINHVPNQSAILILPAPGIIAVWSDIRKRHHVRYHIGAVQINYQVLFPLGFSPQRNTMIQIFI